MKLTILVDNVTYTPGLFAEDGYSAYIEEGDLKILLDTGESGIFLQNAAKLGIDLESIDYLILSHGHHDHVRGLKPLLEKYRHNSKFHPRLLGHPGLMTPKSDARGNIGVNFTMDELRPLQVELSAAPVWLTDKLVYLGQIPRIHDFEGNYAIGQITTAQGSEPDYLHDDVSLAYKSSEGLVIITGCAHSGIGNIIEYAKQICKESRVVCIIGGTHMRRASAQLLSDTIGYLEQQNIQKWYACHCTDMDARVVMGNRLKNMCQGMVGTVVEFK